MPAASAERPVRRAARGPAAAKAAPSSAKRKENARSTVSRDKRLERERRMRERRLRALLRVGLLAAVIVAALAGGSSLYRSQVFAVDTVEVRGAQRLSEDRVREIAAVPADATLVRLPADDIEERLRAEPWVASAEVRRRLPNTVVIEIAERQPAALLDAGGATIWLIDARGNVLGERSAEESSPLVVIRDVPDVEPKPGTRLESEPLANALKVLQGLSDELLAEVRAISAATVDKTALYTKDDVEIFIGSAEQLEQKDLVTRSILEEQRGKVVYINVRTVDRPTWRGLETDE